MASIRNKTDKILEYVIGEIMSITDANKRDAFILENAKTIAPIVKLLSQTVLNGKKDESSSVSLNCLIIISSAATSSPIAEPILCNALVAENHLITHIISDIIINKGMEQHFGLLVNLTRCEQYVNSVYKLCPKSFVKTLINHIRNNELISALLTNLSQLEEVRDIIVSDKKFILNIMDCYDKSDNYSIKNACICVIRNCCFDTQMHQKLLDPEVELLTKLVLPLAGPEEFDDEDMSKLPIDLQYLGADKTREPESELRKLLTESLLLLCSTKFGRECIRQQNIYYILREYHKWEKVKDIQKSVEDVVDILIKKESEINVDDLRQLDIPDDLMLRFNDIDKQLTIEDKQ